MMVRSVTVTRKSQKLLRRLLGLGVGLSVALDTLCALTLIFALDYVCGEPSALGTSFLHCYFTCPVQVEVCACVLLENS
jgi:hypothetical protein